MENIKVDKNKLLAHLKTNREIHQHTYVESMVGYRETLVKKLAEALKDVKAGKEFDHIIKIVRPEDYTKEYDSIIAKLEWTQEEVIELSFQEFDMYVQDNWNWKRGFLQTSSIYGAK